MRYQTQKVMIPAGDGTGMKLLILTPTEDYGKKNRTGILWIHGGGYVTGMAGMVHMSRAKDLVKKYGVMQAPTLIVVEDGKVQKLANASNIKKFTEENE